MRRWADTQGRSGPQIAALAQVFPDSRLHDRRQLHRHLLLLDKSLQGLLDVIRKGDSYSFHVPRISPSGAFGAARNGQKNDHFLALTVRRAHKGFLAQTANFLH